MSERRGGLLEEKAASALAKAAGVLGVIFLAVLRSSPKTAWAGLLLADFYFLSWALAAAVFLAAHALASAGWPAALKRVPEAMTSYLPAGAALIGALCLGLGALYPWADPAVAAVDPLVLAKASLLNPRSFVLVSGLCLASWIGFCRELARNSRLQDEDGLLSRTARAARLSAAFLVVFGVTFTLACVEWLMSLEPRWYSTIYPWYLFTGLFVHGLAAMTALVILLRRRGLLPEVNHRHLHDLGKYLFGLSVFWAYLWFSQYLLIWYSNIPEETAHYVARVSGAWGALFWLNPAVNFVAPFFLLLKARGKQSEGRLLAAAAVLAAGQWLDLYLLIFPAVSAAPGRGLEAVVPFLGAGCLFLIAFDRAFRSAPAVALKDPYLQESAAHRGA